MKTNVLHYLLVCLISYASHTISLYGTITYRLATADDIDELMHIYFHEFDEDDKAKLVTIPNQEIQRSSLNNAIAHQQIYIAYDGDRNVMQKIRAFTKMYIVNDATDMLTYEIRASHSNYTFFRRHTLHEHQDLYPLCTTENIDILEHPHFINDNTSIKIYYGGAFTRHEDRNTDKHLHSHLCLHAFNNIFQAITNHPNINAINKLAILFGQVKKNQHHLGIVRITGTAIQSFLNIPFDSLTFDHFGYKAHKPTINEHGNVLPDPEILEDFGNILTIPVGTIFLKK